MLLPSEVHNAMARQPESQQFLNTAFGCAQGQGESNCQIMVAAGAINPEKAIILMDSTAGVMAVTLPDPLATTGPKRLLIVLTAHGGNVTVTPENFADGASISFTNALNCADLVWTGETWICVTTDASINPPA